jgi:hypothetical protein
MKAETRIVRLLCDMAPLADWMKRFKPACRQMSIRKRDYNFLLGQADLARKHGIEIGPDQRIRFRGFEISSTTCGGISSDAEEAHRG